MSSYDGGGSGDRRPAAGGPPSVFWSLLVIAAALIGGLAAAELEHTSLIITVVVSIAVGAIAVFAVVRWPGQPAELTGGRSVELGPGPQRRRRDDQARPTQPVPVGPPPEAPYGSSSAPGYGAVDPRYPASETEHTRVARTEREPERETHRRTPSVVELIPLSPPRDTHQPGGKGWWEQPGAPPPSAEGRRAPAPDLSTYLDSTVIAQCPRCGAFDLDINDNRDPWAFHCRACDNTWTWRPGTPWPAVRVAPRLRKEPRPPSS